MIRKVLIYIAATILLLTWFLFGIYLGHRSKNQLRVWDLDSQSWVPLQAGNFKLYCLDMNSDIVPCVDAASSPTHDAVFLAPLTALTEPPLTPPKAEGQSLVQK